MSLERVLRWGLVTIAVAGLATGVVARMVGRASLADLFWTLSIVPVLVGLAASIVRDLLSGRLGVSPRREAARRCQSQLQP